MRIVAGSQAASTSSPWSDDAAIATPLRAGPQQPQIALVHALADAAVEGRETPAESGSHLLHRLPGASHAPLAYLPRLRTRRAALLLRKGATLAKVPRMRDISSEASFSHALRQ
jgi:hypothetical protein